MQKVAVDTVLKLQAGACMSAAAVTAAAADWCMGDKLTTCTEMAVRLRLQCQWQLLCCTDVMMDVANI